jgi:hypothetical protein
VGQQELPFRQTVEHRMADIVNLRIARKRSARTKDAERAAENRLAHGASKHERTEVAAERDKLTRTIDGHRIEPGDRE